eukprot:1149900-Pelagomonas_calceolata.AAC.7
MAGIQDHRNWGAEATHSHPLPFNFHLLGDAYFNHPFQGAVHGCHPRHTGQMFKKPMNARGA